MATYRAHRAVADFARAQEVASTASPFTIEVRFIGGLTPNQEAAFAQAADRWVRVIVGDLPSHVVDGEPIDDILILARGVLIDGQGAILGQARPTHFRPLIAGPAALLPSKGIMEFDAADLLTMEAAGTLTDVITHEMGHVLGLGTLWRLKGLVANLGTVNPTYTGVGAVREYAFLRGDNQPLPVPVENIGGPGSAGSHWRESVFPNELMSSRIATWGNPLSRMTVASLGDLGYQVDLNAAEPYVLGLLPGVWDRSFGACTAPSGADGMTRPAVPLVRTPAPVA